MDQFAADHFRRTAVWRREAERPRQGTRRRSAGLLHGNQVGSHRTGGEVLMALIEYRAENGVGIIELNNPPANAYTLESLKQLDEAIVKARFDSNAHVI